ncbi:MAG: hypothetical protein ACRDBG_28115 [Waterburya sp.]
MKYSLDYSITIEHTITVDADSEEDAKIIAEEKLDVCTRYYKEFAEPFLLGDRSKIGD